MSRNERIGPSALGLLSLALRHKCSSFVHVKVCSVCVHEEEESIRSAQAVHTHRNTPVKGAVRLGALPSQRPRPANSAAAAACGEETGQQR